MSDDLLERATRALREESAPSAEDLAETRARLLASSTTKKARRTTALRWVLPLAAAFAAGTAFAATNGQLERAVQAVQTWLVEVPQAATPKPKPKRVAKEAQPRPAVVEASESAREQNIVEAPVAPPVIEAAKPIEQVEIAAATPAASEGVTRQAPARARRTESSSKPGAVEAVQISEAVAPAEATTSEAAPQPKPSQSPDLALYREAHRTHFVARDYADALSLWNAYLARFPGGIFALEAGYNRAICLVRLGRKEEAAVALRPFAEGEVKGAYRRDEARALLDAINKKP